MAVLAEQAPRLAVEVLEGPLRERLEAPRLAGQPDARRAAVRGVAVAVHEAVPLAEANQCRDRLLREARAAGEVAHPQPVLLEERNQHRAVRRTHLGEAAGRECRLELLVPALGRLREQISEVLSRRM